MNLHSQKFRRPLRLILSIFQLAIDIIICIACLKLFRVNQPELRLFIAGSVVVFFKFSALYSFKIWTFWDEIKACSRSVLYAWLVSMIFAYFVMLSDMGNISVGLALFVPADLAARYVFRRVISALGIVPPPMPESNSKLFEENINASPFTLRKIRKFLDEDTTKK